jgi:hypothetical protein
VCLAGTKTDSRAYSLKLPGKALDFRAEMGLETGRSGSDGVQFQLPLTDQPVIFATLKVSTECERHATQGPTFFARSSLL